MDEREVVGGGSAQCRKPSQTGADMIDIDQCDREPGFAVAQDDLQNNSFSQNFDREKRAAQIEEAEDQVRVHKELAALKRQRDMLLEALKPFANEANKYDPDDGDSSQRIWDTALMIGHLREARAAIAAVEGEK